MKPKTELIYDYVRMYIDENGIAPSHQEIVDGTGVSSTSVVAYHLRILVAEGLIEQVARVSRGIRLINA